MFGKYDNTIKGLLRQVGVYDHHITPKQVTLRTLRRLGLGQNSRFSITPDIGFLIRAETQHAFSGFLDGGARDQVNAFVREAKGKKLLLDAGALYGVWSLTFTRMGEGRRAVALEPSPVAFKTLEAHIEINRADVKALNMALGDKQGQLAMKYEWVHLAIVKEGDPYDFAAPIVTLDDFVEQQGICPDIVKIDTEGSEFNILKGGRRFFSKHRPVVFLEVHVPWLKNLGCSQEDLYGLIGELGYRVYDLQKNFVEDPIQAYKQWKNYVVILDK